MTKDYKYIALWLLSTLLITACSNDGSDGNGVTNPNEQTSEEIRFNADVWKMAEATRATMYDGGTLSSGSFTVAAYLGNSTDVYFSPTTVNWVTDKWVFSDGKHYWPMSGNLDFFAYMPATKPSYITEPTYSVSGTPQASFTCSDLPMTYNATSPEAGQGSSLQEFIWGITVGQNKAGQGASGVTMKFRHPFARIKFQLAASHPNIQINSITFKNLKTGGTCTLNNTSIESDYYYTNSVWTSLTPAEGTSNLVMTLAGKDNKDNWIAADVNTFNSNPANVVPIGGYSGGAHQYVYLLVVPQTFTGQIEVNASWNDWGDTPVEHTVSTTIPAISWQAGNSYTYTFSISPDDLTVNTTNFTEQW